ncbi:L-lactate dehydrogenase [Neisseriaceae bacterium ESL0693]|nr:L-lactate dehydrogenase [Neisseriaceae bacterium ESL0693]
MLSPTNEKNHQKIVLVGAGAVGSTFAYAATLQGIGQELVIVDVNHDKAHGDAKDIADALLFSYPKNIYAGTYADAADADVVVITAGAAQKPGESRLDLLGRNMLILKQIVESILASGFNGIFLVASNPVDILTYATWKLSGFPSSRVIGSGTSLDSARLCKYVGYLLGVDSRTVNGYMLGEHGDTEFPAWSHLSVGGLSMNEWFKLKPSLQQSDLEVITQRVVNAAYDIIELKGATFYGVGAALARICRALLDDENTILPVSVFLEGQYGVRDVYIGTPAVLNRHGIREVIEIPLNAQEQALMAASAKKLHDILDQTCGHLRQSC